MSFLNNPFIRLVSISNPGRWRVINVAATNDPNPKAEIFLMTNLKPYTQYAIFVQTYTVAPQQSGKRIGARSRIIYERTKPAGKNGNEEKCHVQKKMLRIVLNCFICLVCRTRSTVGFKSVRQFQLRTGHRMETAH